MRNTFKRSMVAASGAALILMTGSVSADVFTFVYTDSISNTGGAGGVTNGDPFKLTIRLDNGSTTPAGQTWTAAHIVSITFDVGNGSRVDVFGPEDLDEAAGNFMTDSSCTLTNVLSKWTDVDLANVLSSYPGDAAAAWYLNPGDSEVLETGNENIYQIANPGNLDDPAHWTLLECRDLRITDFSYDADTEIAEATIEGKANTNYKFTMAPDLDFSSSAPVIPLTGPGVNPDGSEVTTDGSGNATVEFTLTGTENFVRAESP